MVVRLARLGKRTHPATTSVEKLRPGSLRAHDIQYQLAHGAFAVCGYLLHPIPAPPHHRHDFVLQLDLDTVTARGALGQLAQMTSASSRVGRCVMTP